MFALLFFFLLQVNTSDKANWSDVTEFQLYEPIGLYEFSKLTEKEIASMKYKKLDLTKSKYFLSKAKVLNEMIIWKGGGYLAMLTFKDGSKRKVLLNRFGGTFSDGTGNVNYKIDEKIQDEWHKFISQERDS